MSIKLENFDISWPKASAKFNPRQPLDQLPMLPPVADIETTSDTPDPALWSNALTTTSPLQYFAPV